MNIFTDPQIIAALLTVILTALAAAMGYFIREWISKSTPFMAVTFVDGDSQRGTTRIKLPIQLTKPLEKSQLQSPLAENSLLPDIGGALMNASTIKDRGTEFIELVRQFKAAEAKGDQIATQGALSEIMVDGDFDHWICLLIGERTVSVPAFDHLLPIIVDCIEEPNVHNGTFSIGFPGRTLRFGSSLNNFSLYKSGVAALVELVKRMELSKLSAIFDSICHHITQEIAIAREITPLLQGIVDKHSQWSIRIYLANLGSAPFLVQTTGILEIHDISGGNYSESCSMLILEKDENGELNRIRATSPLVVRSESDVTFEFVTNATQSEMSSGETIRSVFRSGSAQCQVRFQIDRAGQSKRKELKTPEVQFKEA